VNHAAAGSAWSEWVEKWPIRMALAATLNFTRGPPLASPASDDASHAACVTMHVMTLRLPWPVRSVLAGTVGTATMTAAYTIERHVRTKVHGQLDYDDGLVPGQIVASVMHLGQVTHREEHELGTALRWSYGSAFGLLHGALYRSVGEPLASVAFGAVLMSATFSLFPLLGHTPPPWRWPKDVIATSIGTHVAYVTAVATTDDGLRRST
jgi:hypothetical protein